MIKIYHSQMNQILISDKPYRVDTPLNKPNKNNQIYNPLHLIVTNRFLG